MGAEHFFDFLKKEKTDIHALKEMLISEGAANPPVIGVDMSIILYKFLQNARTNCCMQLLEREHSPIPGGEPIFRRQTSLLAHIKQHLSILSEFKLLLCFDGDYNEIKGETQSERKKKRSDALKKVRAMMSEGKDFKFVRKKAATAAFIREDIVADIMEWIKSEDHICAVAAPFESDWQLAHFDNEKSVDCIYSSDSDLAILGCHHVISKLKSNGTCEYINPVKACEVYNAENAKEHSSSPLRINVEDLKYLSCFLGNDYISRPPGCGFKTGHKKFVSWVQNGRKDTAETLQPNFQIALNVYKYGPVFRIESGEIFGDISAVSLEPLSTMPGTWKETLIWMPTCGGATKRLKLFNLKYWARSKRSLSQLARPSKNGKILPEGSTLIFGANTLPVEYTPRNDLIQYVTARSLRVKASVTNERLQKIVNDIIALKEKAPQPYPIEAFHKVADRVVLILTHSIDGEDTKTEDEALKTIRDNFVPLDDTKMNELLNTQMSTSRNTLRKNALVRLQSGHLSIISIRVRKVSISQKKTKGFLFTITAIPSLRDKVPHMEHDCYTVSLCFEEQLDGNLFEFVPAPLSCCDCPKGKLFCSHMIAALLLISIIQQCELSFDRLNKIMPESIRELQRVGITLDYYNSNGVSGIPSKERRKKTAEVTDRQEDDCNASTGSESDDSRSGDMQSSSAPFGLPIVKKAVEWFGNLKGSVKYNLKKVRDFVSNQMQPQTEDDGRRQALRFLRLHHIASLGLVPFGNLLTHYILNNLETLRSKAEPVSLLSTNIQSVSIAGDGFDKVLVAMNKNKSVETTSSSAKRSAVELESLHNTRKAVMHLPLNDGVKSKMRVRPCICGKPECADLSKAFHNLNDKRGLYQRVRNVPERWRQLFPNANPSLFPDGSRKNSEYSWVALHHYHPLAISKAHAGYLVPIYISKAFASEIWDLSTHKRDKVQSKRPRSKAVEVGGSRDYYLVPSYPFEKASSDMEILKEQQRTKKRRRYSGRPDRCDLDLNERSAACLASESEVEILKAKLKALEVSQQELETKLKATSDESYFSESGLTRRKLSSFQWHKNFPGAAKRWLGFESFTYYCAFICAMFGDDILPPELPSLSTGSRMPPLSDFESLMITVMMFRTGMQGQQLETIFGVDRSWIGKKFQVYHHYWKQVGEDLSQLDVSKEYARKVLPKNYVDNGFEKIFALLDGKDFMTGSISTNNVIKRAAHSNKVSHDALRVITYSLPWGLSFLHSPVFFARTSEKQIVELMYPLTVIFPKGTMIGGDRGFDGADVYTVHLNKFVTPRFRGGRQQFSSDDCKYDVVFCVLRAPCETGFARVLHLKCLQDVIPSKTLSWIGSAISWGHAVINLQRPLQQADPRSGIDMNYFHQNPKAYHEGK